MCQEGAVILHVWLRWWSVRKWWTVNVVRISSVRGYLKMQCLRFSLNILLSVFLVLSCEIQEVNSTCLAQKPGRGNGSEERRGGRLWFVGSITWWLWALLCRAVPLWDVGLRCNLLYFFMWHDGSEGSGDSISPPRPQADHLPGQRVQLLVRKSALLTYNEQAQRWIRPGPREKQCL